MNSLGLTQCHDSDSEDDDFCRPTPLSQGASYACAVAVASASQAVDSKAMDEFNDLEMAALKYGYERHGANWQAILEDPDVTDCLEPGRSAKHLQRAYKTLEKKQREDEKASRKRAREDERARKAEAKEAEKKAKRDQKELQRKLSGKNCVQEVVVLLDNRLTNSTTGAQINLKLQEEGYKVRTRTLTTPNSVEWRRFVLPQSIIAEEEGCGIDALDEELNTMEGHDSEQVQIVEHVMVKMLASEISEHVCKGTLDRHLRCIRGKHPGKKIHFLFEGLRAFHTRASNQSFQRAQQVAASAVAAVENADNIGHTGRSSGKSDKAIAAAIAPLEEVEKALVWLQVTGGAGVHQTLSASESMLHILSLTAAIAKAPYKRQQAEAEAVSQAGLRRSVLTDLRKVQGDSPALSFAMQLSQLPGVSDKKAWTIAMRYPTLGHLMQAYDQCNSTLEKHKLLEKLVITDPLLQAQTGTSTNVTAGVKKVGATVSFKVFCFYNCDEPETLVDSFQPGC